MGARRDQHPLLRALASTRLFPVYRGELPSPPDAEQMAHYRRALHCLLLADVGMHATRDALSQKDWFELGERRIRWSELRDFQRTSEVRRGDADWALGTELVWVFADGRRLRHRITSWHPAEDVWSAIAETERRGGVPCRPVKREE